MRILNRDKKVFKVGKEYLIVDIVDPPKYECQGQTLTEYDVRNIQLQVSKGHITSEQANGLGITDRHGNKFEFNPNGTLRNNPAGYDTMSRIVLGMLKESKRS